jgi:fatty acid desaturase
METEILVRRPARGVEWPTVGLAVAIYGGWLGLTYWHDAVPWWGLAFGGAWFCAWHASFQHELVHGHPTRWPALNRALGLPPLLLWLPFDRYRVLHLSHHRDQHLTDPLEDPETQYFAEQAWARLGPAGRVIARVCARLAGRLLIGPVWAIGRFLWRDALRLRADSPGVRAAWAAHLPVLAAVIGWLVVVCRFDLWHYLALFVLPGTALLLVRSLAEHRAAIEPEHRTAIVERAPILGLLFLFNNLHAAHHERPVLAWYRLPGFYRRERARLIARNGGLVYRGYAEVARRFLLRPHDQAVHPYLGTARATLADTPPLEPAR